MTHSAVCTRWKILQDDFLGRRYAYKKIRILSSTNLDVSTRTLIVFLAAQSTRLVTPTVAPPMAFSLFPPSLILPVRDNGTYRRERTSIVCSLPLTTPLLTYTPSEGAFCTEGASPLANLISLSCSNIYG